MNLKKTIALGLSTLMTLQITPLNIFADETSQELTVSSISASDPKMSSDYWQNHRVSTNSDDYTYISAYSNNAGQYSTSYLKYAFDGNWSTHWETGNGYGTVTNYVDVTFNKTTKIDRILYATRQDGAKGKGYPTTATIYSYNSETDTWDKVAVGSSSVSNSYVLITLPQATDFEKLRFEFTVANNGWASASEFVFLRPDDTVLDGNVTISGTSAIGKTLTANDNLTVGNSKNLGYQWQYSDDGTVWTDIENATEKNYTITEQKAYYRVKIYDKTNEYYGNLYSEAYKGSMVAKITGSLKVGCVVTAETEYVNPEDTLYYKWQYSADGTTFTDIPSATSLKYTVPASMSNKYIRLGISGNNKDYIYSDNSFVSVSAVLSGPCQVNSEILAQLKGAENTEYTYQWQICDTADGEFTDISSATSAKYTPTESQLNKYIRVLLTITETGELLYSQPRLVSSSGTYPDRTGDYMYISDVPSSALISSSVGYSTLKYDTNVEDGIIALKVNGQKKQFLKGLGAHAPATLVYDISYLVDDYGYDTFTGYLGVDYSKGSNGNGVIFNIYTSQDNSTWTQVKNTGVLKGDSECQYVTIDLKNAKYLKFDISSNGDKGYDHSVIANGKFISSDYKEPSADNFKFIKTVSQYESELAGLSDYESETYRKILYQKNFVERTGYDFLITLASENENNREALEWFLDDFEALNYYANAGNTILGSYEKAAMVLTQLYKNYSLDMSNSLYKRMFVALMFSHAGSIYFWADSTKTSNPVRRYAIYKKLYENGCLVNSVFENLTVPEMRWVMNSISDDNQIEWLNYYARKKSAAKAGVAFSDLADNQLILNSYSYMGYITGYNYYLDKYYTDENKASWTEKYHLVNTDDDTNDDIYDINIPFESGHPKLWIVFEEGAVCGGISKVGVNLLTAFGIPSVVIGQPGHAAYLKYELDDPSKGENALAKWSIWNDVYGWTKSERGDTLLLGWGAQSWAKGYRVSYVPLAQAALNDYDNFQKAEDLVKIAQMSNTDKAIELYRQAIEIQNFNLDAWDGLITAYKSAEKTSDDYMELAKEIISALTYFPQPMNDMLQNAIKPEISSEADIADFNIMTLNALKSASVATSEQSLQPDICKTMADYILGNENLAIATFSFDGENANTIVLSDQFTDGGTEFLYSIDGGENWVNAGTNNSHKLTDEEISKITADNDLLVKLQGASSYYTIDIKAGSAPSGLYNNDNENKVIGATSKYQWSEDGKTWTNFTDDTVFEGDRTVSVRIGANGTTLVGSSSQCTFTTDTDTADRSYISISNVKVLAYSSAQSDNESASKSIDGNINTIWHTTYTTNSDLNRFIAYEFNKPVLLTSIDYTPRQTGNFNGVFTKCSVYTSKDGTNWTKAGTATWASDRTKKTVNLDTPVYTKYVKVVGDEAGANFGSAAMIEFYERLNSDNYDINKDNSVDNKDVALLLKYVMGVNLSSDISFENADFNGDGNIDMLDVITLKNYTDNNTVETTTETTETTTEQQ